MKKIHLAVAVLTGLMAAIAGQARATTVGINFIAFDTAGCEIASRVAALAMLPDWMLKLTMTVTVITRLTS